MLLEKLLKILNQKCHLTDLGFVFDFMYKLTEGIVLGVTVSNVITQMLKKTVVFNLDQNMIVLNLI